MDPNAVTMIFLDVIRELFLYPDVIYLYAPMVLVIELPLLIAAVLGILHWRWRYDQRPVSPSRPSVSVVVTCYSEGAAVRRTLLSIAEQIYSGHVEIIAVVDGAAANRETLDACLGFRSELERYPNRTLIVLPKWQRGGLVSSLNAGCSYSSGEIVLRVDGDSSFDNDMLNELTREFDDPSVPAVGGTLKVRNASTGFVTRMQAIEYMISLQAMKTGLAEWNVLNNISGAFGAFRREFLMHIGAFDTHTAEDLDVTIRIKQYFGRYPSLRIAFAPLAIAHTDVPDTFSDLLKQRLRWDGDLIFLFLRKHRYALTPRILGWRNFIFTMVYGVFQSSILPIVLVIFHVYLFATYSIELNLALLAVHYVYYLAQVLFLYSIYLFSVSGLTQTDWRYLVFLPIFPVHSMIMRAFTAFAVLNEVFRRGHEETNMAPWWVLKRGERF